MEDILEVYRRPDDPKRPLVCIDEASKQQVQETREPLPRQVGKPKRYDYEYDRHGVSNLLMIFAPLEGWRRALYRTKKISY
jgi:hypothetical protein